MAGADDPSERGTGDRRRGDRRERRDRSGSLPATLPSWFEGLGMPFEPRGADLAGSSRRATVAPGGALWRVQRSYAAAADWLAAPRANVSD